MTVMRSQRRGGPESGGEEDAEWRFKDDKPSPGELQEA